MKLIFDPRAEKFLDKIRDKERTKVFEYILLFEEYGFELDNRYLKKVTKNIWELRPKNIRLFFIKRATNYLIVHAMYKKSQKITKKTLKLLEKRIKSYL
ncbi:hypothetical protein A2V56_04805 [Candidatus Woesebacteria bacterium RBG_19FT_COMBO_42_9]|uniref:Addiction module toxin RelE n=1 Tax=Candidatus Woesebacteria bacterium RBG_16_42_24 TaxID=1802485 RepID=A0A1F7XM83_9BACT|nr:MAG: hypothetical protein A2V97_04040 [Candidatus Woesebacteria bacterium RBG_16_42_24]OGM17718.1 MAG: hypothetical protein A2V56_04805 [Candidatus Woesebacteria bacterium RBG_19FT_COMBO_42_9]OGM66540.1 MAG: hypothetical protein A2985_03045 [Candidatus Woesebacteria bacterium RIFCSPLOWO2_01_FULL_43_11]